MSPQRARQLRLQALGLCQCCGQRPAMVNQQTGALAARCQDCNVKHRKQQHGIHESQRGQAMRQAMTDTRPAFVANPDVRAAEDRAVCREAWWVTGDRAEFNRRQAERQKVMPFSKFGRLLGHGHYEAMW